MNKKTKKLRAKLELNDITVVRQEPKDVISYITFDANDFIKYCTDNSLSVINLIEVRKIPNTSYGLQLSHLNDMSNEFYYEVIFNKVESEDLIPDETSAEEDEEEKYTMTKYRILHVNTFEKLQNVSNILNKVIASPLALATFSSVVYNDDLKGWVIENESDSRFKRMNVEYNAFFEKYKDNTFNKYFKEAMNDFDNNLDKIIEGLETVISKSKTNINSFLKQFRNIDVLSDSKEDSSNNVSLITAIDLLDDTGAYVSYCGIDAIPESLEITTRTILLVDTINETLDEWSDLLPAKDMYNINLIIQRCASNKKVRFVKNRYSRNNFEWCDSIRIGRHTISYDK